jgi:hypothetical protein
VSDVQKLAEELAEAMHQTERIWEHDVRYCAELFEPILSKHLAAPASLDGLVERIADELHPDKSDEEAPILKTARPAWNRIRANSIRRDADILRAQLAPVAALLGECREFFKEKYLLHCHTAAAMVTGEEELSAWDDERKRLIALIAAIDAFAGNAEGRS